MLARTHVKLTTKIGPKFSLCPQRHFTEQLTDVFKEPPRESD
jgi:hypothetical protein